jgi:hypothetical protein
MKRIAAVTIALVIAAACVSLWRPGAPGMGGVVTLEAQTLPISRTLAWDAGANADSYIVTQDGTPIGTPVGLTQPISIATLGSHTFSVVSVNLWGQSAPATLTVNVVSPGQSGNIRIR